MLAKKAYIKIDKSQNKNLTLKQYEKNVYSQFGQDGVLENVLSRIGPLEKITCLEVGGWDGVYLSNICNLARNLNANCIFIESNKKKYNQLLENHNSLISKNKVFPFNALLSSKGENTIGQFVKKAGFNHLDFLSIDIDGMDYFILRDLDILPKVILIEFNSTFHPDVIFIQPENSKFNIGSSSTAIAKLAEEKGYSIVHYFDTDLLLVKDELIDSLNLEKIKYQDIRSNYFAYIGFGYNAEIYSIGNGNNNGPFCPWEENIKISPKRFQVLPTYLRYLNDSSQIILFSIIKKFLRFIYLGGIKKKFNSFRKRINRI